MANIKLKNIYKVYDGGVQAVTDFNLDIDDKEFVVLVGPSGCGKSTTLRMIAGLETITAGELYIGDKLMNDIEPKDRDITMVFQNYALYPHMTVYQNMAFGLKQAKCEKKEIDRRVREAAKILGIEELLTRTPKALSGGQRQRVALGRSIVREPKVFLFDEPLSNLDAKLRVQMRSEITKLHQRLQTTFIYVTHDQTEAMTMGSKIVVMKKGVVQQVDSPKNLYDYPANIFVATFLGLPQMNLFDVKIDENNYEVQVGNGKAFISKNKIRQLQNDKYLKENVIMGIRPEDVHLVPEKTETSIEGVVDVIEVLGNQTIAYFKIDGKQEDVIAILSARDNVSNGDTIYVELDTTHVHLFDKETEKRIIDLPVKTKVEAKLTYEDEKKISYLDETITLSNVEANRILPEYRKTSDVLLCVKPNQLSLEPIENGYEFEGKIELIEKYTDSYAVYSSIGKQHVLLSAKVTDIKDLKEGDKVTLYASKENVSICENEEQSRINAKYEISPNNFVTDIEVKNGVALFKVCGSKMSFVGKDIEPGKYEISLPYSKFVKADKKHNNNVIKVKGINEDRLENCNILYVSAPSVEEYLSIKVPSDVSIFDADTLKFCVEDFEIIRKVD